MCKKFTIFALSLLILSSLAYGQVYNILKAKNIEINKEIILGGYRIYTAEEECNLSFSKSSLWDFKPYLNGEEWSNKMVFSGLTATDVKYSVVCSKDFEIVDDKLVIKNKRYNFNIDFSSLRRLHNLTGKQQTFEFGLTKDKKQLTVDVDTDNKFLRKIKFGEHLVLDPTYYINNITNDATLSNVRCEGSNYFCHLSISDSDLKVYSSYDFATDGSIQYDYTNNDNDGTVTNAVWQSSSGFNNTGRMYMDGTGDYINYGDVDLSGKFSISMWVYFLDVSGSSGQTLAAKGKGFASAGAAYSWALSLLEGASPLIYFDVYSGSVRHVCDTTGSFNPSNNVWYHIVAVWNNSASNDGARVWVNNVEECGNSPSFSAVQQSNYDLMVGTDSDGAGYDLEAYVDEFMYFNKELSQADIQDIYDATYTKYYGSGTHNINQTVTTGNNRVNVTVNLTNDFSTNVSASVYNSGWSSYINLSDDTEQEFTIDSAETVVNVSLKYHSGKNRFYTPYVYENITLETWNADSTPPMINSVDLNDTTLYENLNQTVNISINCSDTESSISSLIVTIKDWVGNFSNRTLTSGSQNVYSSFVYWPNQTGTYYVHDVYCSDGNMNHTLYNTTYSFTVSTYSAGGGGDTGGGGGSGGIPFSSADPYLAPDLSFLQYDVQLAWDDFMRETTIQNLIDYIKLLFTYLVESFKQNLQNGS